MENTGFLPTLLAHGRTTREVHPTRLYSIGKSTQGRDIWCLKVTTRNVGDPDRKPGMYIDGNIHGNEIQASETVAYTAWYLCHQYGRGGYDMNRNWAYDWQPNYVQYGAKDYPFSQPETRAVAEFVLAHPNIAAAQSYHNSGGMILRGPGREGGGR